MFVVGAAVYCNKWVFIVRSTYLKANKASNTNITEFILLFPPNLPNGQRQG
jgi:hypothetical protein